MSLTIIITIAVLASAAAVFMWSRLQIARARLLDAGAALARQREEFDRTLKNLETTFKGLSSDVLKDSRDEFMKQAEPKLDEHVRPLLDALKRYDETIRAVENKRESAYGGLKRELELLQGFARELRDETGNLKNALKSTTVRGRWGELTLRRVAELSGMVSRCDFDEQTSVTTEDGRLRPDMIVNIPGGRKVVVDAKAPLDGYLKAVEATNERDRRAHLEEHAKAIAEHMRRLSQKSYWEQFDSSTDFVVMFVPGESFASAALEIDRNLLEDGMRSKVILATPTTLVALLRSFAFGWQQEQLAENAQKISDEGKELFDRFETFSKHFGTIGANLDKAIRSFNSAVSSMQSRVIPSLKRLKELGATRSHDALVTEIEQVETSPNQIASPEANNDGSPAVGGG